MIVHMKVPDYNWVQKLAHRQVQAARILARGKQIFPHIEIDNWVEQKGIFAVVNVVVADTRSVWEVEMYYFLMTLSLAMII